MDIVTLAIAAAGGGGGTMVVQTVGTWFKARVETARHSEDLRTSREQHNDKLAIELMTAAREEVAAARVEAAEMRSLQLRLTHFEEAIDHIQALYDSGDDPAVRRRAQQFLTRMRRISDARGAVVNEVQIIQSRERIEGDFSHDDAA